MRRHAVPHVDVATANAWLGDTARTTYLLDIRTAAEVDEAPVPAAVHAPGGQLVQATDHWLGVRFARVVLLNQDGIRAGIIAKWLREMGHEAYVLDQGAEHRLRPYMRERRIAELPKHDYVEIQYWRLLDLRESMVYRQGHAPGATWSIRPRVAEDARGAEKVAIISQDPMIAAVAAIDLRESGAREVVSVTNAPSTRRTPGDPPDDRCIDFSFFAHGRHDGDRAAAEKYLDWEKNLVRRLTSDERALLAVARHGPDRAH
jgi:rhodanese-related sulfurtransferase